MVQNIAENCIASLGLYSHWIRKLYHFISGSRTVIPQLKLQLFDSFHPSCYSRKEYSYRLLSFVVTGFVAS